MEEAAKETTPWKVPQQLPLIVTLDGLHLCSLSFILIFCLLCLGTHFTSLILALSPVIMYIHNDYHNFLRLGPGGTPSSLKGYLIISFWRPWTLRDPFHLADLYPKCPTVSSGNFSKQGLPCRDGPRPRVVGIAPQRQLDQNGTVYYYKSLRHMMKQLVDRSPAKLHMGRSIIEKHGLAMFATGAQRNDRQAEICHVHDSDHSMHMKLHPDDIKHILEKGWGQRHPLACRNWLLKMPVPSNFVMIYAPRCE